MRLEEVETNVKNRQEKPTSGPMDDALPSSCVQASSELPRGVSLCSHEPPQLTSEQMYTWWGVSLNSTFTLSEDVIISGSMSMYSSDNGRTYTGHVLLRYSYRSVCTRRFRSSRDGCQERICENGCCWGRSDCGQDGDCCSGSEVKCYTIATRGVGCLSSRWCWLCVVSEARLGNHVGQCEGGAGEQHSKDGRCVHG